MDARGEHDAVTARRGGMAGFAEPLDAAALLRARYGASAPSDGIAANDVLRTILGHRSVRAFRPEPLPAGTLETLVAAAQSAPTSSNLQAWSVVAVEDPARRARLAELAAAQGFIRQAPLFLAWLADLSRLGRVARERAESLEGVRYLEAFMVALVDAALAAQNATVAAESLGLGCVYVGALRNHPEAVAAELGLPPDCMAVFGLSVGVPDAAQAAAVKPRLPQSVVLHRERYATAQEAGEVRRYDTELAAFSARNGMGEAGWTDRVLARVGTVAALRGRDRMREALNAMGFGLR
jgi:nitroreductase